MNKYLQILIGITTVVWLVIGIGVIAGFFILVNLPKILGVSEGLDQLVAPIFSESIVEFNCVERTIGIEKATKLYQFSTIDNADSQAIENCFR